ncbi:MAG: ABC transporter ATP-binding protein [Acidobacteriota bacterium]|nr:ABC transporter ATP-binding protein [Acidobacteriota bacterium]
MKNLLAFLKPYKIQFIFAALLLCISAVLNSAMVGLVAPLMDSVLTDIPSTGESRVEELFDYQEKIESVVEGLEKIGIHIEEPPTVEGVGQLMSPVAWGVFVFIIFTLQAIFEYLGVFTMNRIGLKVVVGLRQDLIDKVMSLSLGFFKRFDTGEIISRISSDVMRVQNAISMRLGEIVKEGAKSIAFLILAFLMNWKLSLFLFVLLPVVGIPISIITRKIRKNAMHSQNYLGSLTGHLKEVLVGIRIVKGFQKEKFESERLQRQNDSFFRYALREVRIVALTAPVMSMIGMSIILTFVWYGATMVQSGEMGGGDLLTYVLFVYSLYQPIKRIARSNTEVQQAVGVLPRIEQVMNWQNEITDPPQPQRFDGFPAIREIRFEGAHFNYGDAPVLQDIQLAVPAGKVVALVGPSGSGKSTLVNLLPRFYDVTGGAVTINGLDLRRMSRKDLRGLIGVVTQDTILFNDTVHNNIAYGMNNIPRERVAEVARQAFADTFIQELPQGYDTLIGESGGKLSGGQRQRISIARAILKDAPVLVLDEATSALDTESEREVQLALENLMKSKTTFVIAHRLSTIRKADEIIVLHEGRIVERGSHGALMENKGMYHRLVRMQEEGIDAL